MAASASTQPQFMTSMGNGNSSSNAPLIENTDSNQIVVPDCTVSSFDRSLINAPGPCVLFATPGMIRGGFSLEVFKHWAPYEANLVTLPGYCLHGTVGHKLRPGKPTKVDLDQDTQIDVRCQVDKINLQMKVAELDDMVKKLC